MNYKNVIEDIKRDEGYDPLPYIDPRKLKSYRAFNDIYLPIRKDLNLTIGYGTLLPLSQDEAEWLLKNRLKKTEQEIIDNKPFFVELPENVKEALLNMGYNLGVPKQMKFKRMWEALENEDYQKAADEMIDSKWYRQNTDRVKRLSKKLRQLK